MPATSAVILDFPAIREPAELRSVPAPETPEQAGVDEHERRAYERFSRDQLGWLRTARFKHGPPVSVVDLSRAGALLDVAIQLRIGASQVLELHGPEVGLATPARVLRCHVSRLAGGVVYRAAFLFDRLVELEIDGSAPRAALVADEPASLALSLNRLVQESLARAQPASHAAAGVRQLTSALRALGRRAICRGGDPVGEALGTVVGQVVADLDRGEPATLALARLEVPLQRALLAIGARGPGEPGAGLQRGLRQVGSGDRESEPVEEDLPAAWNRLVVHYADGKLLKGYSQDFHPSRWNFHLWPAVNAPTTERMLVPMKHLKGVFFVRDFAGDPNRHSHGSRADSQPGRRIEVTFLDGEVMTGSTLSYQPDGAGFFVFPSDQGNNTRVFVISGAIRHVRFL